MKRKEELKSSDIEKAARVIKKGGVVVFPTDTVFGIGCRWDNKKAVNRIYKIKSRPPGVPFPILLANAAELVKIAKTSPLSARLIKRYWPGALTVILKLKTGEKTVGFRIPDNAATQKLISGAGIPIVGTSANLHGKPPVKNSAELDPNLIQKVDYVLQGTCKGGVESTVVDLSGKKPKIIRQGAVKIESYVLYINTIEREKVEISLTNIFSAKKYALEVSRQTGSQALIPAILRLLKKTRIDISQIDEIEVNVGPGSFTGTRVGVTVANVLGFALQIPVNGKVGKIVSPVYEKSKFD